MRALNQTDHLFEFLLFGGLNIGCSLWTQQFTHDTQLCQLSDLIQQCMLVALPGVVLSDYIVKAIDLLLAWVGPFLQGLYRLVQCITGDLESVKE